MKHFSHLSRIAFLLLPTLVLPAIAGKPFITVTPITPFVIPAADGCGTFDLYVAPEPGRPNGERLIEFANAAIAQGPVFLTVKNLSTGNTISLNVSGPSMFSFTNNTAIFGGASFPFGLPANLAGPAGLPAVGFAHGRIVVGADAFGNIISVSFTGTVQDVCKELE